MLTTLSRPQHAPPELPIQYTPRREHVQDELAWAAVMRHAATQWDHKLDRLIERTVADIKRTVGSKRAAFVWTGGKESLVLEYLAGLAGIRRCVLAITDLEYGSYLQWVTDRMPDGLTVVSTGQDLAYVRRYPHMMFPRGRRGVAVWHAIVQECAQDTYFHDENLGMLLLGYRRIGDYAYGPSRELTWRGQSGVTRYTPLVDWTPAAMLALIQRERIPFPPCLTWPRGLQVGPGPWPARGGTTSISHGFEEVWKVQADLIREAAASGVPHAKRWLAVTGRS